MSASEVVTLTEVPGGEGERAALMARYQAGDRRAFDRLYALAAPGLLRYLRAMVRERATAEDLLQQTFINLHRSRGRYQAGADPLPWLYTIAHRLSLDELRRRRRARVRLGGEIPPSEGPGRRLEEAAALDGQAWAPEPEADPREALARSLEAIARLPCGQRRALELTKLEGRSLSEAAAQLGTTVGAVKLRTHRACLALRRTLTSAPTAA